MYSEEVRGGGTALSEVLRSRVAPRAKALMLKQTLRSVLVCETTWFFQFREVFVKVPAEQDDYAVKQGQSKCRVINKDAEVTYAPNSLRVKLQRLAPAESTKS